MIKYVFYICLYFLLVNVAVSVAQQPSITTADQLEKAVYKQLRVPRSMTDTCTMPVYTAAKLMYRKGALVDTMLFSGEVPPEWKAVLVALLPIYKEVAWKKFFPATVHQQDFDIYVPFICLFDTSTGRADLSPWERRYRLDKIIADSKTGYPYYTLKIADIESTGIRCYMISSLSDKH